ncbi:MAG: TspO/MBR family protein [Burkholderiaceae bacterium]
MEPVTGWRQIGSGKHLAIFVAIVFVVAAIGGLAPPGEWYEALNKPPWTPPNWLFGPAWTLLYLMVAVAGWIIFTHAPTATTKILWSVQMVVNAAWSLLFFGAKEIGIALIDVTAMSVLALVLIIVLLRHVFAWSRLAAVLFMPYWVWVTFAGALNASIWLRNPVVP